MDKTPNQYIQWRYATGEDREGADSVFRKATKEEEDKMAAAIKMADGTKKVSHVPRQSAWCSSSKEMKLGGGNRQTSYQ